MHRQENTMIIGLDLDGVIIDHTQNKIKIAARYGINLALEDTSPARMWKIIPPELNQEIRNQMYDDTDEALSAPLMEGAYSGLAKLREQHIPYFLVSRRKKPIHAIHLLERRELWGKYFIPENTFFVDEPEEKDIVAHKLGLTHFVDDELRVLDALESVPNRILFDARNLCSDKKEYHCVENWSELLVLLGAGHS
jgi:FMN phosphatase YigB (HAD superfamily)